MFTKQHRRIITSGTIANSRISLNSQPINWCHVAAYTVIGLCGVAFFGLGLLAIYYGG